MAKLKGLPSGGYLIGGQGGGTYIRTDPNLGYILSARMMSSLAWPGDVAWKGTTFAYPYPKPLNYARGMLKYFASCWRTRLTTAQKNSWVTWAATNAIHTFSKGYKIVSGFRAFMSLNTHAAHLRWAYSAQAPNTLGALTVSPPVVTPQYNPVTLSLTTTSIATGPSLVIYTGANGNTTKALCMWYITDGRRFAKRPLNPQVIRAGQILPPLSTTYTIGIKGALTSLLGPLKVGMRLTVVMQPIHSGNLLANPLVRIHFRLTP